MSPIRGYLFAATVAVLLVFAAGTAWAQPKPAKNVQIHILVIEASKTEKGFDPKLDKYQESMPGYVGAKLLDELSATAEEGSSVSLVRKSGTLKVTVRKVEPDSTIKLRVAIEELKFSTDTTHKNGSTFFVAHPLSKEKALFLAVTPKTPSTPAR